MVENYIVRDERVKSIPYPPDFRPDGIGYGFLDLKGQPEKVSQIVEAKDLPGLQRLLRYLCSMESPFFSVGCEKASWKDSDGSFCVRGYVEFCFNFPTLANFRNYESIQKSFGLDLEKARIKGLDSFEWRVSPVDVSGVNKGMQSCAVWTSVSGLPNKRFALNNYDKALAFLAELFEELNIPHSATGQIFGPGNET